MSMAEHIEEEAHGTVQPQPSPKEPYQEPSDTNIKDDVVEAQDQKEESLHERLNTIINEAESDLKHNLLPKEKACEAGLGGTSHEEGSEVATCENSKHLNTGISERYEEMNKPETPNNLDLTQSEENSSKTKALEKNEKEMNASPDLDQNCGTNVSTENDLINSELCLIGKQTMAGNNLEPSQENSESPAQSNRAVYDMRNTKPLHPVKPPDVNFKQLDLHRITAFEIEEEESKGLDSQEDCITPSNKNCVDFYQSSFQQQKQHLNRNHESKESFNLEHAKSDLNEDYGHNEQHGQPPPPPPLHKEDKSAHFKMGGFNFNDLDDIPDPLLKDLLSKDEENERLQAECKSYRLCLDRRNDEISKLKSRIKDIEAMASARIVLNSAVLSETINPETLAKLDKEISEQEAIIAGYQKENEKLMQKLKLLESSSAQRTMNSYDDNKSSNLTKAQTLADLLREKLMAEARIQELSDEIVEMKEDFKISEKKLRKSFEETKRANSELHTELLNLQQEKSELKEQLEKLLESSYRHELELTDFDRLKKELEEVKLKYNAKCKELKEKLEFYEQREALIQEKTETIKRQNDIISQFQSKLNKAEVEQNNSLPSDLKRIHQLEKQVKQLKAFSDHRFPDSFANVVGSSNDLQNIEALKKRIRVLEEEIKEREIKTKYKIQSMSRERQTIVKRYEELLQEKKCNVSEVSNTPDSNIDYPRQTNARIIALEEELAKVRKYYRQRIENLSKKQSKNRYVALAKPTQLELERMQAKNAALHTKVEELQLQLANLQGHNVQKKSHMGEEKVPSEQISQEQNPCYQLCENLMRKPKMSRQASLIPEIQTQENCGFKVENERLKRNLCARNRTGQITLDPKQMKISEIDLNQIDSTSAGGETRPGYNRKNIIAQYPEQPTDDNRNYSFYQNNLESEWASSNLYRNKASNAQLARILRELSSLY